MNSAFPQARLTQTLNGLGSASIFKLHMIALILAASTLSVDGQDFLPVAEGRTGK
ncbi:hypothetical protein ACQZ5D_13405 [Agrobacterium sp. 22-211-1]